MALPLSLSYAHLRNRHPAHDAAYWRQLRALMAGGKRLLGDTAAMDVLFPPNPNEELPVYEARRARAFHLPYPGEIVGDLVGQLAQDPPVLSGKPEPEPWYTETFSGDVDRRGLTLLGYAQAMAREALTVRTAWALVALPGTMEEAMEAPSLADQEARGLLRAYACPLAAEDVIDWEEDAHGELLWGCVYSAVQRRASPGDRRDVVREEFGFYDRAGWARFVVEYPVGKPPRDADVFTATASGAHGFGVVPLLRLELPEGLWAMDKMFGAARAHFQQRSAFSYAQFKHLFPILTAFLGPEAGSGGEVPSDAQQGSTRATDQTYGVGRVVVFGKDDRLTYTAPPAGVFTVAAEDLRDLRDEMHRVCAAMAAAMDGSPAAVGRSGESKAQDKSAKELVLMALGVILCDHLRDLLVMVARGRGEAVPAWSVAGFRLFDNTTDKEAVENAQLVQGLSVPSATFRRVYLTALAQRVVAHDATPEELRKIGAEIEANVTDEEFAPLPPRPGPGAPPSGPPGASGMHAGPNGVPAPPGHSGAA